MSAFSDSVGQKWDMEAELKYYVDFIMCCDACDSFSLVSIISALA